MRRLFAVGIVLLVCAGTARANGILIPEDKKLPPLAMLNHEVTITVDDQVAITTVEQTFRNHTKQALEASYIFPVPKGASVRKFSMWVNGKEVEGEMVQADLARKIYTELVHQTMDPGLLEQIGNNLLRIKVFPVPANSDAKVKVSYTSIAVSDHDLIEYVYPLRTAGQSVKTLEKFSINVHLKSQHALQNIYSPSHNITTTRTNDREAVVTFSKDQALLDRDFQLYYTAGKKDVGLTTLTHRPNSEEPGFFLLLASPRAELSKEQQIPRDMVFVLDTSGSMRGKRMDQARNALKYCLKNLAANDRFALINFSTLVHNYHKELLPATPEEITKATKWVDKLQASGGTAINDALEAALALRTSDASRPFTIVFFTDGEPTIGEINIDKILDNVAKKNTASTRIFTFGVVNEDDINASFLDRLADQTRAVSTYVRETEDIEAKVSSLYAKISNPVLSNLKLSVSDGVQLSEVYPPQLPDLFHGSQLVVLGRYEGTGKGKIILTGNVGKEVKEFVYEIDFAAKTNDDRAFVEDLWARRKVGYLLDQIRANGEKKELVEEVVLLAKRYGITTPYTSYLIVPDAPVIGAKGGGEAGGFGGGVPPVALQPGKGKKGAPQTKVEDFAKGISNGSGGDKKDRIADARDKETEKVFKDAPAAGVPGPDGAAKALQEAKEQYEILRAAKANMDKKQYGAVQAGQLGVNLSLQTANLRNQNQVGNSALRKVSQRTLIEIGGVWIDEDFDCTMKTVTVKAMSKAYFSLLERQPKIRDVLALGNHLVWVTPSGTALIIDTTAGVEQLANDDIDRLFVPRKRRT
jgi:Ca-activated chloride channel family protein